MKKSVYGFLGWSLFAWGLLTGCEKINPEVNGPSLGEDAVVLSCEGCHTTRSYLRKLAVEEGTGSAGGG